jgi:two-component system response regulator AlgR
LAQGQNVRAAVANVLVVDDEAPARRRLRDLLDDCSTHCCWSSSAKQNRAREALDLPQSALADSALTDIRR